MTRLPPSSAASDPSKLFTSSTSSAAHTMSEATPTNAPAPTPLPPGAKHASPEPPSQEDVDEESEAFKLPKLRLMIEDVSHPGAKRFLAASNASTVFAKSVQTVLRQLYYSTSSPFLPGTRSVTLYLEDMDGVAYTKGSSLDNDHKEIHFSIEYIANIKTAPEGAHGDVTGEYEIAGVLVHELVHCFQYNGRGHCPSGLIEGIADWVRLRAHLGAAHWRRSGVPDSWDQGYEKTAYFLDWLEEKHGKGTVRRMNEKLRDEKYEEKTFWKDLFGKGVDVLWGEYVKTLRKD